ncbi:hypothetical protein PR202_gb10742 [Eleusine coracana subsp. coracana]|uniref:Alpha N-terminal protein methyltransferase 1 n=1 Tax=Eleusine coracana subsp. coracana TaxID=191504 RepID=A0AAV5EL76_ELECO|nr:hypothetical protein PR202_gb10742 [Eleusine coracana subsp. coracana]
MKRTRPEGEAETKHAHICWKPPANTGIVDLNPFPVSSSRARPHALFPAPAATAAAGEMDSRGYDSGGRIFSNATEMWAAELGSTASSAEAEATPAAAAAAAGNGAAGVEGSGDGKRKEWYSKAISYWQSVEASTEGVLGGYGCVNDADVKGSDAFLRPLIAERFGTTKRHLVALGHGFESWKQPLAEMQGKAAYKRPKWSDRSPDPAQVGATCIGLPPFEICVLPHSYVSILSFGIWDLVIQVDLVEPVPHFLEAARENLTGGMMDQGEDSHMAVNFYCVSLQDFTPEEGRYDVIWVQWCIGQLPDDDFISFFNRAKIGLKPDGFFVLKENIAKNGFVLDKEDNSVTRSDPYFRELFKKCGLYIHSVKDQKELPKELFAVKMYALVTDQPKIQNRKEKAA